jgi:outer membrane receptor for ferrienterochelin and colicin
MKAHKKLNKIALAVLMSAGMSGTAFAQETSSGIRGIITGPQGNAAAGTVVTITHEPSGTVKTTVVNESGSFVASGLRVGGPYKVEIDSEVFRDKTLNNIFLSLGETFRVSESLEDQTMETIVVSGSAIYDYAAGSNSTFGRDQISRSAAFSRDLKDIVKQNPLAVISPDGNRLSIAGSNPRYNSLQVDGVNLNDDFGLASNGYPTERSPIVFDSIDQISVATSPFTAKEGGFSGGKVSVVTKSGTNEFSGSVFYEMADDSWAGTPENPSSGDDIDITIDEKTYGATFGGPIIKDKLFFFASYETFEEPSSVDKGPAGSGAANETANITQADVDRVVAAAQNNWGFDAGSWNDSIPLEDEKYSLKIDWNINEDHRASFTYGHGFSNSAGRAGEGRSDELFLSSHWYNRSNEFDTYVAQLFSNWSDEFSTEAKISYKDSVNGQVPLAGYAFGEVKIEHNGGEIDLGPDDSRHANELTNETLQFHLTGEYLYNDHTIAFGWEYESVEVFNLFMQHNLGSWYFDSIEDFENGNADWFEYQNNPSLNRDDAAANLTTENHSFYIEDSWDVTYDFNLTYGLRYERLANDDVPKLNQLFVERHGFDNTENLDGKDILLPRIGFNWDVNDELTVRGGAGKFSGGRPNVWVSNAYTNDGTRIALYRTFGDDLAADFLANADPTAIPQRALDVIGSMTLDGASSNIDAIDPDFEIPYTWQYSIAADYIADLSSVGLGEDWFVTAEVLYKDAGRDLTWSDLSRTVDTSKGNNGYTVDGRPIYGFAFDENNNPYDPTAGVDGREARDILMTNIDGGKSLITTFSVAKQWDNGVDINFSYTNQDIEEISSTSGTTTSTAYEFDATLDPQRPVVGTSSYETEHRLTFNFSYNAEVFQGYNTGLHVFWERKSNTPYTWVLEKNFGSSGFDGDLDLQSTYLAYIPTGPSDPAVDFVNGASYDEIIARLEAVGASTKGGYLDRNTSRGPWITTMDVRVEQEIPGFMEDHRGVFYIDIKNALAMFDKDAAQVYQKRFVNSTADLLGYEINDAGQYVYDIDNAGSPVSFLPRESTWVAKIGVKYRF